MFVLLLYCNYRNNASKRPLGHYDFALLKRRPGAFTAWPRRFVKNDNRTFWPPGVIQEKTRKHTHTHTRTHLSHAHNSFDLCLDVAQEIMWWRGLRLQVRALNTMWAFDLGAAMPWDWTLFEYDNGAYFFLLLAERVPHRSNLGCALSGHQ